MDYAWPVAGGPMDYLFYLTVLSLLYVARVDTVYIHGDLEPAGQYWADIKRLKQTRDKVKFITRTQPLQVNCFLFMNETILYMKYVFHKII